MPEINTTALLRRVAIVNAIAATSRVSALLSQAQPQSSNAALSNAPLTSDQAGHLLRHVVAAQLQEHGRRQLLSPPPTAPAQVLGSALTEGRLTTVDALRSLINDSAATLARIFPATGNPIVLEHARAILWRAIAQHFYPSAGAPEFDDEPSEQTPWSRRNSPDWLPFAWTTLPQYQRKLQRNRKRIDRSNDERSPDDAEDVQTADDPSLAEADTEPGLLDIADWLQRQDRAVDYASMVTGEEDRLRAGGLLDDSA